jgi:hypothetical protein
MPRARFIKTEERYIIWLSQQERTGAEFAPVLVCTPRMFDSLEV